MVAACFGLQSELSRQLKIAWFCQKRAVGKSYGGNDTFAVVGFYDKFFTAFIFIDVNPIVWNLVFTPKNCLLRRQSGHQCAPYTVIFCLDMSTLKNSDIILKHKKLNPSVQRRNWA